jgi:hypothetical protein
MKELVKERESSIYAITHTKDTPINLLYFKVKRLVLAQDINKVGEMNRFVWYACSKSQCSKTHY